jgi:hypothetical protein
MNEMKNHYRDEEILKLNMSSELKLWQENISFMEQEIGFYLRLLQKSSFFKTEKNIEDLKFLVKQLQEIHEMNSLNSKLLRDYKLKAENIRECDDVQCENQYVQEHLHVKNSFQKHLKKSQIVKGFVFKYILENMQEVQHS